MGDDVGEVVAPGWYPDNSGTGLRWWTGIDWSDYTDTEVKDRNFPNQVDPSSSVVETALAGATSLSQSQVQMRPRSWRLVGWYLTVTFDEQTSTVTITSADERKNQDDLFSLHEVRAISLAELTAIHFLRESESVALLIAGPLGRTDVWFGAESESTADALVEAILARVPELAREALHIEPTKAEHLRVWEAAVAEKAAKLERKRTQRVAEEAERARAQELSVADKVARIERKHAQRAADAAERERTQALKVQVAQKQREDLAAKQKADAVARYVKALGGREPEATRLLNAAIQAAREGDMDTEEGAIAAALTVAKAVGFRGQSVVRDRIAELEKSGHIRPGSELLGMIKPVNFFTQLSRGQNLDSNGPIEARNDRVLQGGRLYRVDSNTSAQVFLDGQQQVTQRPTLTRMVLLAPLPGSALLPALALQKKEVKDMRTAEFHVVSAAWQLAVPINPSDVGTARSIAERINRIATHLARQESAGFAAPTAVQALSSGAAPTTNVVEQLSEIQRLLELGAISADEAQRLKSHALEQLNS
jgi:hypothetical protein